MSFISALYRYFFYNNGVKTWVNEIESEEAFLDKYNLADYQETTDTKWIWHLNAIIERIIPL